MNVTEQLMNRCLIVNERIRKDLKFTLAVTVWRGGIQCQSLERIYLHQKPFNRCNRAEEVTLRRALCPHSATSLHFGSPTASFGEADTE
jgi:hypothetical protein